MPDRCPTAAPKVRWSRRPKAESRPNSLELHLFDTIKGSDWLGDHDSMELLVREAPRIVYEYEHMGCVFSRLADGRIAQRRFGGHSAPRACYAADWTGHVLLHTVHEQALALGVRFYSEWYLLDLVVEDGECRGVVLLDIERGTTHLMRARAVLLATGGYGRAYQITSNAHANTGDGVAIAYRAGVPLMDMEFVQFHPTGLYRHGILMSEACRGEGGHLLNRDGERFMERYAASKMELAPRDLVSRSEQLEINAGRGVGPDGKGIHLDLRHLGRDKILERLPQVRELAMDFVGVDPIDAPVPIQPTAHYSMGGIPTDNDGRVLADGRETPLTGLYAAGECACVSVHGANRLGTNSLLDASVFGRRAGEAIADQLQDGRRPSPISGDPVAVARRRLQSFYEGPGDELIAGVGEALKTSMTDDCGVFRDEAGLRRAEATLLTLRERFGRARVRDQSRTFNTDLLGGHRDGPPVDLQPGDRRRRSGPDREPRGTLPHRPPAARRQELAGPYAGVSAGGGSAAAARIPAGSDRLGEVPAAGAKVLTAKIGIPDPRSPISGVENGDRRRGVQELETEDSCLTR